MKPLPNFKNAVIDIEKLRDYCLNPLHPVGKHKAKVFKSVLGIERKDAAILKEIILANYLPQRPKKQVLMNMARGTILI